MNKKANQYQPPRWSLRLLRMLVRHHYLEEIEGDMEEVYADHLALYSPKKARRLYNREVFKLIRPALVRKLSGNQKLNYYGMFKHNILLSLRIFKRYKSSFLINLTGLATGLACVLLIYLWVADEISIDRFHTKKDRLYQVMGNNLQGGNINTWNGTSAKLAEALAAEVPEVEFAVAGTDPSWNIMFDLTNEEKRIKAVGKHAGPDYFHLFSYDLLQGDPDRVLTNSNEVVISDRLALNLFNSTENVVGKTLHWINMNIEGTAIITGIFKAPPVNSTEQFDMLLPFEIYTRDFGEDWQNPNSVTYVLLKPGAEKAEVNAKIEDFLKTKVPDTQKTLFLKNYADQYLYGNYQNGVEAGGRIEYIRLFSIIAAFILIIACINFMNLSTARASRRIKEVGVKKAVGAGRQALVFQYLSESVLMAFLSLAFAFFLVLLVLPEFNLITGKQLSLNPNSSLVLSSLGIALITGLLSGSYPALYLSGFNPALVLKGVLKGSTGELWVRKGLVIFQFSLSIIFIVAVLVVFKQMELIQTKNLGFDKENILYFEREGTTVDNLEPFLEGLKNVPGVENASVFNNSLFSPPGAGNFTWEGMEDENHDFRRQIAYYDYIETLGIELKEGRTFSREFPLRDEWQIVINETAAEIMGFEEPVGKKGKFYGTDARIIGVVKDFHFRSLHEQVGPVFFQLDPRFLINISVRIAPGNTRETIARLEAFYEEFNPGFTLNYKFLDEDFQQMYDAENKVAALSRYFAGLAIIISCLGLLGLVAFSAERRIKEIGIRKILGSGNLRIVYMLSADFTRMVLAAIFIALPISYFLSRNWLNDFAYPIDLQWWFFAAAGLLALVIAWLTVGFQTIKAATVSPVRCLRDD